MAGNRPTGVAILAVLDGLGGVLALLLAIAGGAFLGITGGNFSSVLTGTFGSLMAGLLEFAAILLAIVGILGVVQAYGLWNGKKWGWWLTTVLTSIGLVFGLITLLLGSLGSVVDVIIEAIIVYYMLQKPTKAYFGM